MARIRLPILAVLTLAAGGCAARPEPSSYELPAATLAPIRLVTCPARVSAPALVTTCPQEPR